MDSSIFNPKSIAIVGASTNPDKIASVILKNLLEGEYNGKIYPVNPKYEEIQGRKVYPDILSIQDHIDTVCIVIPHQFVEEIVDQCIEKGVKTAVIISAGFKETGKEGAELEERIKSKAQEAGLRILGPNCLGYINNKAKINLSFARENPGNGNIAFISQSGAFCTAVLDMACKNDLGFAYVVSVGNKADIQENELIEYIDKDKDVKAIALYLEEFSDGKEFVTLTQKSSKPILLIAPGSSEHAKEAISSHTGSLASSYDTTVAAVKKGNIIQADNSEDLFKLMKIISYDAIPKGRNIAIVTNAGGPGIIATDAVEKNKLNLSELGEKTIDRLKKHLPNEASMHNPVDILGDALSDRYEIAIDTVLKDVNVDSILTILTPQLITEIEGTAEKIANISKVTSKPIFNCFLGGKDVEAGFRILNSNNIPVFDNIEEALRLISKLAKYKKGIETTKTVDSNDFAKKGKYKNEVQEYIKEGQICILPDQLAIDIANEFKLDTPNQLVTSSKNEAVEFAAMNFPVAIKASAEDLAHKTDFKGLFLDIRTIADFEEKFDELKENITQRTGNNAPNILIQEMIEGKLEFFIGANREGGKDIYEPNGLGFGHLLAIGQGGIYTEVYKDIKHILVPECKEKIEDIFSDTKVSKIIEGYRGKPALAKDKILELINKIQSLLISYPEIVTMDINPVMITEDRAVVLDIKIYVRD
jgi:acetyl coenzyme A synthetase (ADP forming)-like protein